MTRSGCASVARLKGRCPLISAKVGIGHTNSSHFGGGVNCLQPDPLVVREGVAETATPSTTPPQRGRRMPGLELRSKVTQPRSLPEFSRDGRDARPVEVDHRRGRRMPAGRPQTRVSAAAQRQRDKARVVTLLHADQDRPFALRPRGRDDLAHIRRR